MGKLTFLTVCITLLGLTEASLAAQQGPSREVDRGIRAEEKDSWVAEIARGAGEDLERRLHLRLKRRPAIYMCGSDAELKAVTGRTQPGWVLAVACPKQGVIAVDRRKLRIATDNDITVAIRHEMVHMILAELPEGLPRWFEEGIAETLSGRLIGKSPDELKVAARSGCLFPLSALEDGWPKDSAGAALAYTEARSAVLHLLSKYGRDTIQQILLGVKKGLPFEESFRNSTRVEVKAFEKDWVDSFGQGDFRLTALMLLAKPPYIYIVMAILSVVAFLVYLAKRRWILRRLDEEEF